MVLCNAWTARDVEWIINYCLPLPLDLPLDIPLPLDLPPLEFDLDFPFPLYFLRFSSISKNNTSSFLNKVIFLF